MKGTGRHKLMERSAREPPAEHAIEGGNTEGERRMLMQDRRRIDTGRMPELMQRDRRAVAHGAA